jgi:hypothetical protein
MILEVPKENVIGLNEKLMMRKKRIRFYTKLGIKVLDVVNYLLSNEKGDNITWISKKSLADFVHLVYISVYEYPKTDLCDKTITNLPDLINIKELRV